MKPLRGLLLSILLALFMMAIVRLGQIPRAMAPPLVPDLAGAQPPALATAPTLIPSATAVALPTPTVGSLAALQPHPLRPLQLYPSAHDAPPYAAEIAGATPQSSTPGVSLPSPTVQAAQATPSATATTGAAAEWQLTIGWSVGGQPIVAYRFGSGPFKVALTGDIHGQPEANTYLLVQQLLDHFTAHPAEVPSNVSLWLIPTMNPDGLAAGTRENSHGVDLNRNSDTDLDGCAGNDWSSGTFARSSQRASGGGEFPFSEPEVQAVREFLDDAWIAVFYHSAAGAIYGDTCGRHLPTLRLAQSLSLGTGYPIPEDNWTSYPVTGALADYLAGEGVAAVDVELTDHQDPEFDRNLAGVRAMLAAVDGIVGAEAATVGADSVWLDDGNTGVWHYPPGSFIHPVALEVLGETAYLLDGGRVLGLDLGRAAAARILLAPGDQVQGMRVLEPLDLAVDGSALLVLDRAGDLYRFEPEAANWALERVGRPSGATSDHYYVAVAAAERAPALTSPPPRFLLETTHEQVWSFAAQRQGKTWVKLPQGRDVDLAVGDGVYVLARSLTSPRATLLRYLDSSRAAAFKPNVDLMHPRQVFAGGAALYVLDRGGRRVLALDPENGALRALYQFADRRPLDALWAPPSAGTARSPDTLAGLSVLLAGRDTLYFYGQPEREATVEDGPTLDGPQPHDPLLLEALRGLQVPITGATVTRRDFQMPGAPRHYRLGVHEGADFYSSTVGVTVDRSTPVRAVADGVVIRAMLDYKPLTAAQAAAWSAQCHDLGYTPPDILDGYRGRQVWIEHAGGVVSHYAHLGTIAPGIVVGAQVKRGQVIATVGNSGTPNSVRSQTIDVHLHLELWVGDHNIGQFMRPIETREWLERILR